MTPATELSRLRRARSEATRVFGSRRAAYEWMATECQALGFKRPRDRARTKPGFEAVMALLVRIDRGVYT